MEALILAGEALLLSGWWNYKGKDGWVFITGSLTIVLATIMVFMGLFPHILISSIDPAYSLTIQNATASPYTLNVMTIVTVIFLPFVLVYQIWTYRVFRNRVKAYPETLVY